MHRNFSQRIHQLVLGSAFVAFLIFIFVLYSGSRDESALSLLAMGLIFYFTLFLFLSLPNVIFSLLLTRLLKAKNNTYYLVPLLFPIAGVLFYLTVDYFEKHQLGGLWIAVLTVISLMPVILFFLIRKRR
jgi:hypothetical protein